jgi:hypothetical protein
MAELSLFGITRDQLNGMSAAEFMRLMRDGRESGEC